MVFKILDLCPEFAEVTLHITLTEVITADSAGAAFCLGLDHTQRPAFDGVQKEELLPVRDFRHKDPMTYQKRTWQLLS